MTNIEEIRAWRESYENLDHLPAYMKVILERIDYLLKEVERLQATLDGAFL